MPAIWEKAGHPAVDGVGWFQKRFELSPEWAGQDLGLRLGAVDDGDTTWVNGAASSERIWVESKLTEYRSFRRLLSQARS